MPYPPALSKCHHAKLAQEDGQIMATIRRFRKPHLVFDLDGTLIDSAPDIAAAINALFAELNLLEIPVAEVRRMVGEGAPIFLARALERAGSRLDPAELMARYAEHYIANTAGLTTLYPGVLETLAQLAEAGCRFGLCTNKPHRPTLDVLSVFGLDRFFGAVVTGESMDKRKPSPEPLLAALREIGGEPGNSVMIGDSVVDQATAVAAGVASIIIPSGYGMAPVTGGRTISDFLALPAALAEL
jgi:phosphoglycolate phosphatase